MIRLNAKEFDEIVTYIREHYGINLEKKQVLIECRLARELERRGITSFARYMELMKNDRTGIMAGEMVNRLTTNYTYFMREPAHFTVLGQKILPELFENRSCGVCNIWSAGCSTGEEVYSVSMLIQELKEKGGRMPGIRMLATDISGEALRKAEQGIYPLRRWSACRSHGRENIAGSGRRTPLRWKNGSGIIYGSDAIILWRQRRERKNSIWYYAGT